MATTGQEIILAMPVEILGPESDYEKRRIALRQEYAAVILAADAINEINDAATAEMATDLARVLRTAITEVDGFFTPVKRSVDAFKRIILDHERDFLGPMTGVTQKIGTLILKWNQRQELERVARERAAREQAEREAREEQIARAVELDESGDIEAAEALLEEPVFVPVVAQATAPTKLRGQVTRTNYSCTVTSLKELVKAVAEGRAPIQCLQADQSFLDAQARAFKEAFSIPGCKLNRETKTSFRS